MCWKLHRVSISKRVKGHLDASKICIRALNVGSESDGHLGASTICSRAFDVGQRRRWSSNKLRALLPLLEAHKMSEAA